MLKVSSRDHKFKEMRLLPVVVPDKIGRYKHGIQLFCMPSVVSFLFIIIFSNAGAYDPLDPDGSIL